MSGLILSICIPTCNRARYLENLLADLVRCMGSLQYSCEILIGDNFSTDETQNVVRSYANRLPIRYFRRPENLGILNNLGLLYDAAKGKYCVYLADDDFLIIEQVREILNFLEFNPQIGMVQGPWLIHDRVTGQDFGQFYYIDQNTIIERRDFRSLLSLILHKHIFPEIFVCRTSLIKSICTLSCNHAYWAFVQSSAFLNNSSVCFWSKPFYKFVNRYWSDEPHLHAGGEELRYAWDRYRGGLEYILSFFSHQISAEERRLWLNGIEQFTLARIRIALHSRVHDNTKWIENYYLARRLMAGGAGNALPLSYDQFRINAALEYLCSMQPHAPMLSHLAHLSSEKLKILNMSTQFAATKWLIVDSLDRLPDSSILVTDTNFSSATQNILTISESKLIDMFP